MVSHQRDVRRSIGFVGQGNGAGHQQRGRDELVSQGRAHGLSRVDSRRRAAELLESFDLTEHADRLVSTLSGGQRRRLDIAIGLVHTPRLVFLDEPSTGLDPQNRANLQEQVRWLHEECGTTIVLTTHCLEDPDAIADRVVVIDQGLLVFPILLLAGVLLPPQGAPGWLQTASDLNPLKYVVEAERALFSGSFPADTMAYGFLGAGVLAALGLFVGLRAMQRSS